MKKIIIYCLAAIFITVTADHPAKADERSGIIIKQIMDSVDKEMTFLEDKTAEFDQDRAPLIEELNEQAQAFHKEKDPLQKETLRVDVLLTNAKLNNYDIKEVGAYLETITSIVPKLQRVKKELIGANDFSREEDFHKARNQTGKFLTKAYGILSTLKETAPKNTRNNIEVLENNLVGILARWNSPLFNTQSSIERIDQTINDLEEAYSQLSVVNHLLKQEKTKMKVVNYTAIANLFLIRLGKGHLNAANSFLATPAKMRADLTARSKITNRVINEPTSFTMGATDPESYRNIDDRDALNKIMTGNYSW